MSCILCFESENPLINIHEKIEHFVHQQCLQQYFNMLLSRNCPLCRQPLSADAELHFVKCVTLNKASILGDFDGFQTRLQQSPNSQEISESLDSIVRLQQTSFLNAVINHLSDQNIQIDLYPSFSTSLQLQNDQFADTILNRVFENQNFCVRYSLAKFFTESLCHGANQYADMISSFDPTLDLRKSLVECIESACRYSGTAQVQRLINNLNSPSQQELDNFFGLAHSKTCRYLFDIGASVYSEKNWLHFLHQIDRYKEWDTLKYFIESGVDVNYEGGYALSLALKCKERELIKWLKRRGAKFNATGIARCLEKAVIDGDLKGTCILLNSGAAKGLKCDQLLAKSLRLNFYHISKLLIAHGADYDVASSLLCIPDSELKRLYENVAKDQLTPWFDHIDVQILFRLFFISFVL